MNKRTGTALLFCLMFSIVFTMLFSGPAFAAAGKSLSVGLSSDKATCAPGKTVVITVKASDFSNINTGIYGFTLKLGYDAGKFDYVANSETLLQDKATGSLSVNASADTLTVVFYDDAASAPMNHMSQGDLMTLSFQAKNDANGSGSFAVSTASFADSDLSSTVSADISGATAAVSVLAKPLQSISLSPAETTILKGKNATLSVSLTPSDTTDDIGATTWQTSDAAIATVSNGVVTGVKAGTATITATVNGKSATCDVTVQEIPLDSVSLNETSMTLVKGKEQTLTVSISPNNTTDEIGATTWQSSNDSIASVSDGVIAAKSAGTATITATVNGKSASCTVTVQEIHFTAISLNESSVNLDVGGKFTLTPSFLPADATDDASVTWASSNEEVATVQDGVVTAKKAGSAVITATVGGLQAQCTVTVKAKTAASSETSSNAASGGVPDTGDMAGLFAIVLAGAAGFLVIAFRTMMVRKQS